MFFNMDTALCAVQPSIEPKNGAAIQPSSQPTSHWLTWNNQFFVICRYRIRIGFGNSEFGIGGSVRQRIADSAASEWILNLGFVIASKPGRRKEHRIGVGVGLATLVAWQSWQDFSGAFVWGLVIDWWPGDWIWVWHCVGIGGGKVIGLECGLIRCCF
jgi:hypothetical protein